MQGHRRPHIALGHLVRKNDWGCGGIETWQHSWIPKFLMYAGKSDSRWLCAWSARRRLTLCQVEGGSCCSRPQTQDLLIGNLVQRRKKQTGIRLMESLSKAQRRQSHQRQRCLLLKLLTKAATPQLRTYTIPPTIFISLTNYSHHQA